MKTIKISRSNFPSIGNFSWMNYFYKILSKKYKVEIDSKNPDIIFFSNLHCDPNGIDHYTKQPMLTKGTPNSKRVFISGEAAPDYENKLNHNVYVLGYEKINHKNYLRLPTYVLDAFTLHNEGGMFEDAFGWITKSRNAEKIISQKKHFCSVVQGSDQPERGKMFDLIEEEYWIKSSGPWRGKSGLDLDRLKYHRLNKYIGRIDGLTYVDKVNFFKDCYFNIAFHWCCLPYMIQEKIIHAFAADTIPIFWGNTKIEEEGFNPPAFINTHSYSSFEECFAHIKEIYLDHKKLKSMYSEPIFTNNKLPDYFSEDYLLTFFEHVIND